MKGFGKLVKKWQRYCHEFGVFLFCDTAYYSGVCFCSEEILKKAGHIARDQLLSFGTCFGKFTKTSKFRLHITALDYLAPYAKVPLMFQVLVTFYYVVSPCLCPTSFPCPFSAYSFLLCFPLVSLYFPPCPSCLFLLLFHILFPPSSHFFLPWRRYSFVLAMVNKYSSHSKLTNR